MRDAGSAGRGSVRAAGSAGGQEIAQTSLVRGSLVRLVGFVGSGGGPVRSIT